MGTEGRTLGHSWVSWKFCPETSEGSLWSAYAPHGVYKGISQVKTVGNNEIMVLLPNSLLGGFTKPSESRISETNYAHLYFNWKSPNFYQEMSQFRWHTIVDSACIENVSRNTIMFVFV